MEHHNLPTRNAPKQRTDENSLPEINRSMTFEEHRADGSTRRSSLGIRRRTSLSAMAALFTSSSTRNSNHSNSWGNASRQPMNPISIHNPLVEYQAESHRHRPRRPSTSLVELGRGLLGHKRPEPPAKDLTVEEHRQNWFRKMQKPFRKDYTFSQEEMDAVLYNDPFYSLSASAPVCPDPRQQWHQNGGAAARLAAAASNEANASITKKQSLLRELQNDSESGIGIDLTESLFSCEEETSVPVFKDPGTLPEEIFSHCLSFLDAKSLDACIRVNRRWSITAGDRSTWRKLFASEFGSFPSSKIPPIYSGGLGYGTNETIQQWHRMYKARAAIQENWRTGQATAIYLEGHTDTVYCVQFDEDKVVTGSRDRTLRVWDAKTWKCLKVIGTPKVMHSMYPISPLTRPTRGSIPTSIIIHPASKANLKPEEHPPEFTHAGSILCLQFDKDILVTGSSDTTVMIWSMKNDYKPIKRLREHTAGVLDVCFDDKYIISCSKDTTICVWSRRNGELIRRLSGHRGPVNAVQLRGDLVVSASGDGVSKLWNVHTGVCVKEFASRDRGLACVEFSPDGSYIYAGGNDQSIYQFDAKTKDLVHEFKGHRNLVRSLHLDQANNRIVSGSYDHSVQVYDTQTGKQIAEFAGWTTSWMLSAKCDYRYIIATSQDRRVVVMDFGKFVKGTELLRSVP